ncbi:MAG: hypothetical protein ABJC66_01005 [Gammaproteobacteria bacterium]
MGHIAATLSISLLAIPCVHAGEPALNAQQLAITERVLKFCGPVNPDAAKKLQEKISEMVKGRSEADLATARDSEEYKKGYAMIDGIVAQDDEQNAKALCKNSAADK